MKKRTLKLISVILVAAFLLGSLCSCNAKNNSKIKTLFNNFESACKAADVDKVLDCCDPNIIGPARSIASFIGIDSSKLSSYIFQIIDFSKVAADTIKQTDNLESIFAAFSSLTIKPKKFNYNDEKTNCSVTAEITYTKDGEKHKSETVIKCVQRDEEWYFSIF